MKHASSGSPAVRVARLVLLLLAVSLPCAFADTHYVAPAGGNESPYTNWAMAAHKIQDAINVASAGATVLVAAGTYDTGGRVTPGYVLTNRVVATNRIEISAVDGRDATFIVGDTGSNRVRCAYLSGGATLANFTLVNGSGWTNGTGTAPYDTHGGGAYLVGGAQVSNCVVRGCLAVEGGGLYIWQLGYAYDCAIYSNRAGNGGGVRFSDATSSTVARCSITRNWATSGGGSLIYHAGRLENCLIAENESTIQAGGVRVDWGNYYSSYHAEIVNCTIAGNTATAGGCGGTDYVISGADVRNTIIYGNSPTNWTGGNYQYCCTTPQPSGSGNISSPPQFADADYRLASTSPCINAGTNAWARGPLDLDRNARIVSGVIDLGAYEYSAAGGQTVTTPNVPTGDSTNFMNSNVVYQTSGSTCSGGGTPEYRFNWGDGNYSDWTASGIATHSWSGVGTYYLAAQARCATNPAAVSAWSASKPLAILDPTPPLGPTTHYAAPGGGNVSPYTNWAMAAHKIQDAINVAVSGGRVIVSNGVYAERIDFGGKDLEVQSLYDATGDRSRIEQTVIDGGGGGRVVVFEHGETAAARLSGFTIQNGSALGSYPSGFGGGVGCFNASPRLEHLIIRNSWAYGEGGGLYLSWSYSSVKDVRLEGNAARQNGGGFRSSYGSVTLDNMVLVSNRSESGGAMLFYHTSATMKNSLIVDNVATGGQGGGAIFFDGCSPTFENLTIRNNRALNGGGGGGLDVSYMSQPVFRNCILWSNQPQQVHYNVQWYGMAITLDHCDVQGGQGGIETLGKGPVHWLSGNLEADPMFVSGLDSSLQWVSPCKDTGTNQAWMVAGTDLAGNPRICNAVVDMGAYEYTPSPQPLGSIACILEPPDVRALGAQWRVTSGPDTGWKNSGDTVCNLEPGDYAVTFTALSGWTAPDPQLVTVVGNAGTNITGTYQAQQQDTVPPVIVSVFPWDGYVTESNKLWMTIIVTDNVGVASVTVNGRDATNTAPNTFLYEVKPLNGQYHFQEILATDVFGNEASQTVCYAQSGKIRLTAIWNGYWRVRNPFDATFPYLWYVKENPAENGSGVCPAHSDDFFYTSLGSKHVVLTDTNGVIEDEKGWSPQDPPAVALHPAFVDSDGDGLLNITEDIAGSDPEDATNRFEIGAEGGDEPGGGMRKMKVSGGQAIYAWRSSSNSLYTLEVSTNLCQWTKVPEFTDVPGTGGTLSYTNTMQGWIFFLRTRACRAP